MAQICLQILLRVAQFWMPFNIMGNIVIDFELITRNFSEGIGTLEMLCIYEIKNGLIQKASFAIGEKRLN